MKRLFLLVLAAGSLAACNDEATTKVSVEVDSIGQELDTLGRNIGKKAEDAGDSVKSKFNDIKANIRTRLDSIKKARKDTVQ